MSNPLSRIPILLGVALLLFALCSVPVHGFSSLVGSSNFRIPSSQRTTPTLQIPKTTHLTTTTITTTALSFSSQTSNEISTKYPTEGGSTEGISSDNNKNELESYAQQQQQLPTQWTAPPPAAQFDPLNLAAGGGDRSSYGAAGGEQAFGTESSSSEWMTTIQDEETEKESQELTLWAARGLLLLIAAIWGTNFACVKYLNDLCFHPPCNHPPSEFAFARFGIAALVSIPLLLKQRRDVVFAGFECGLWITLGYVTQSIALASISAGECAFICSLTVVFVPLVSTLLYGQPLKIKDLIAGAIAISGVAVLEGMVDVRSILGLAPSLANDASAVVASTVESAVASSSLETANQAATASSGPLAMAAHSLGLKTGDLVALGQPIGFGFAFTRIEHYQEKFSFVPNRVLTIAAAQCAMVGLMSFFWMLYDYDGVIPDFGYMIEPHRIATLAWTGIVTTLVAIYMEGIALQKASATDASIAFASEPVWASLFGFLLLGETLGFNAYVGGSIILAACLIGAVADLNQKDESKSSLPDEL